MRGLKIILVLSIFFAAPSFAKGQYLTPQAFLQQSFGSADSVGYEAQAIWLNETDKQRAKQIFQRDYAGFRVRYWQHGSKTAWIFDEIGKTRPITIGVVLVDDQIEAVSILAFRESRGSEIRHPFFTQQFVGLTLEGEGTELSDSIDGITGATLSVRAATRVARFALYLNGRVDIEGHTLLDE